MQYQSRKWLGLLLAVLMLVSLLPVAALAADAADVTEEELTAYALDGDDANGGGDDVNKGGDDVNKGDDDVNKSDDDVNKGDDVVNKGDDDVNKGGDDVNKGDDDVNNGGDDVNNGDDDVNKGDDDVNKGDDDANKGDNDANNGDDEEKEKQVTVSFPIEKTVTVKNKGADLGTNTFKFLLVVREDADSANAASATEFSFREGEGEWESLEPVSTENKTSTFLDKKYYSINKTYEVSLTVNGESTSGGTVKITGDESVVKYMEVDVYEIGMAPENWEYGYQMYCVGFCDAERNLLENGGISKYPKLTEEEAAAAGYGWPAFAGSDGFYYQQSSPEQVAVASYTNTYTGPGPAELSFSVEKTVAVKNKGANPGKNTFEFLLVVDYPLDDDFQVFYTPEGGEPQELTQAEEKGDWEIDIGDYHFERAVRYYSFSMTVDGAATAKGALTVAALTSTIDDTFMELYEVGEEKENWEYGYELYSLTKAADSESLESAMSRSLHLDEITNPDDDGYEGYDGQMYSLLESESVEKASFTNIYTGAAPASSGKHAPKTGDEANLALWLVLATVSTAAIAVVVSKKKVK